MTTYLLDVNVLIALAWPTHVHHQRAQAWWAGVDAWATTPPTESAFLRLCTRAEVVGRQVSMAEARAMLDAVRATSGHEFLDDNTSLAAPLFDLTRVATSGQVTDAWLVNIAASHDAVLATMDAGIESMLMEPDRRHVLLLPRF